MNTNYSTSASPSTFDNVSNLAIATTETALTTVGHLTTRTIRSMTNQAPSAVGAAALYGIYSLRGDFPWIDPSLIAQIGLGLGAVTTLILSEPARNGAIRTTQLTLRVLYSAGQLCFMPLRLTNYSASRLARSATLRQVCSRIPSAGMMFLVSFRTNTDGGLNQARRLSRGVIALLPSTIRTILRIAEPPVRLSLEGGEEILRGSATIGQTMLEHTPPVVNGLYRNVLVPVGRAASKACEKKREFPTEIRIPIVEEPILRAPARPSLGNNLCTSSIALGRTVGVGVVQGTLLAGRGSIQLGRMAFSLGARLLSGATQLIHPRQATAALMDRTVQVLRFGRNSLAIAGELTADAIEMVNEEHPAVLGTIVSMASTYAAFQLGQMVSSEADLPSNRVFPELDLPSNSIYPDLPSN